MGVSPTPPPLPSPTLAQSVPAPVSPAARVQSPLPYSPPAFGASPLPVEDAQEATAPGRGRSVLFVGIGVLVLLGALGFGWYWVHNAPTREFNTQLASQNLVSGPYSAYTVYQRALGELGGGSPQVRAMGEKVYPLLSKKATAFLDLWYRESEVEETSWEDYVRIREWMQTIGPEPENKAQLVYAQGMFLLTTRNQVLEAKGKLEQALSLKPEWAMALNGMGRIYKNLKDYSTAKMFYERAYQQDRQWCYPAFNLGNLHRDNLKDFTTAEMYYREALRLAPDRPSFHWQLGTLYFIQGKAFYPQACEAYRQSLMQPPAGRKGLMPEAEAQARDRIQKCCGS